MLFGIALSVSGASLVAFLAMAAKAPVIDHPDW